LQACNLRLNSLRVWESTLTGNNKSGECNSQAMTHPTCTSQLELVLETPSHENGSVTCAGVLQGSDFKPQRLWIRIPEQWSESITDWADPFVVGLLYPMILSKRPVHIRGRCSPSLLANLELLAEIWRVWRPGQYHRLEITADEEIEMPRAQPDEAIMSFSGGLDSAYTAWQHRMQRAGRNTANLTAGIFLHGFDIPLWLENGEDVFQRALAKNREMLASIDMECIPIASNFQELEMNWHDGHIAHTVSAMMLLGKRFNKALVPASLTYRDVDFKYGTSPMIDALFSSNAFEVVNDGSEARRDVKAKAIADWETGLRLLRVCFGIPDRWYNCCRCEKCIRSICDFRIAGVPRPPCFPEDATDQQIRNIRIKTEVVEIITRQTIESAEAAGFGNTGWVKALRRALRANRRYRRHKQWRKKWRAMRSKLPLRFLRPAAMRTP
jgi:hypothetical protein